MREYASTMKELLSLVAHASNRLLVNAVRMIRVNLIQLAKIMELVLAILKTIFLLQDANVMEILLEHSVTYSPVIFRVITKEYVMMKLVNAVKRMESQNIMVKVVICLLLAMEVHVRMVVRVRQLFKVKLRPVL